MGLTVLSVFTELYPRVLVSSTSPADSLTVAGTASGGYSLRVLTVVTAILLPGVPGLTTCSGND